MIVELDECTVVWGDGGSYLHDWLEFATPEMCKELLEGIDNGDPDRILIQYGELTAYWDICVDGYYPYCSNCKKEPNGGMSPYCPNCGAKMIQRGDEP